MKKYFIKVLVLFIAVTATSFVSKTITYSQAKAPAYMQLKVYHYNTSEQEAILDKYLQNDFIPALHAKKINNIGVFKFIGNDTVADKRLYVFIPFKSIKEWEKQSAQIKEVGESGDSEYSNTPYNAPAYTRIETIFLQSFKMMSAITPSALTGPKSERVYELRSYESPSEKLFRNKVQMFNEGGETEIFSRLGFNPVFYGEVIFGARMPNLMYMTSFENMDARKEHWKSFSVDSTWKKLAAMKEYQKNVSKNEITFLRATDYSDL